MSPPLLEGEVFCLNLKYSLTLLALSEAASRVEPCSTAITHLAFCLKSPLTHSLNITLTSGRT